LLGNTYLKINCKCENEPSKTQPFVEGCGRTERKSEKMNGEKSKVSVSVAERQHLSCISSTCFCLLLSREIWTLWSLVFKKGKDIFLVYTTSTSAPGPTQWLLVFY